MRDRLVSQRTGITNQIRAFMLERGIAVRQGIGFLRMERPTILATRTDALSPRMLRVIEELAGDWRWLDQRIDGLSGEIEALARLDQACLRPMTVPGIGPIISSAMVAAIGTGDVFSKGRDFGAWLGLVPKQISTGDRTILGKISRRGNRYLRVLFVQAARLCWPGSSTWNVARWSACVKGAMSRRRKHSVARLWLPGNPAVCYTSNSHSGRRQSCGNELRNPDTRRQLMNPVRPFMFWIATLAAVIAAVALLREILLPFVAGMVLAYLLDAPVNWLERIGMNRAGATLTIIGLFAVGVVALVVLTAPLIGAEIADFIENFPAYIQRLHALATNPGRPWLRRIVGEGFGVVQQSSGDVASLAARWLTDFLHSLWSGGRALISVFSLLVVTPIVTFYLVYDWNRIVATVDDWIPAEHRDTARALAREIDETIGGFLRGQGAICLILAACYAVALKSIGLKSWIVDRPRRRPARLHSLSRRADRTRSVRQHGVRPIRAGLDVDCDRGRYFLCRPVRCGLCSGAPFGRPPGPFEPGLGDVRVVRVRIFVRLRRPPSGRAARGRHRRADAVRLEPISRWRSRAQRHCGRKSASMTHKPRLLTRSAVPPRSSRPV